MEYGVKKWRYALLISIIIISSAVFFARLVQWQVFQTEYYDDMTAASYEYTVRSNAIRGEIYDCNGLPLAVNKTGYRVMINKIFMPDDELNWAVVRLTALIETCGGKWIDELPIIVNVNGEYVFDEEKSSEIERLKSKDQLNMNHYSTASECMLKLVEKYGCENYTKKQQHDIISVRYNMDKQGYSRSNPYIFADGISERAMSVISENMQSVSGVEIESTAVRTYENGTAAPHIVGVTGLISEDEYTELKIKGYGYTDMIGKSGIEYAFEKELRGSSGSKTYEVSADGKVSVKDIAASKPGNSVYLTIDSNLQKVAQKALKEAVQEANDYSKEVGDENMGADCKGAAIVVLDVRDFSVICAANYPSYDLTKYYSDYEKLASDKNVPMFDRAFMGALAPGSTFKPMVASAALQEKAITTNTHIDCEGVYTENGLKLWCMGYHGWIDVYEGICESCNVFFAETARLLGIENMNIYAKRCGLGVKTGIEITESSGTLAGPEYSHSMGSEWYESFVSTAGIGQSDNQFTPLQLATYAATLANNGIRLRSHVVDRIVSYYGGDIIYETEPEVMDNMGVSEQNLKEVKTAMNMAAHTYYPLEGFEIDIAGKTGTAENSGSDHANFICFAPYDDPKIAIGVMVEHGAKSKVAINAAKKVMREYFKNELAQQQE